MPTFDTPEPISVSIAISVGDIRIAATDRRDTVVEVRPSDVAKPSDVREAEQTHVEYADGRLVIQTPKSWVRYAPFAKGGSIDIAIELPAGSRVECDAGVANVHSDGPLGECQVTTGVGNIRLDETGPVQVKTSAGSITIGRAVGRADVRGSGQVRIRIVEGPAVIKNLNGVTWVGDVTGELHCNSANGDITVDHAREGVSARTANGAVRIGEVVSGSVELSTAYGELEVGISEGTAALLDVRSKFGSVRNSLAASQGPEATDRTVEVRARTSFGDIVVRRSGRRSVGVENNGRDQR
jgi:hypothetical protein